MQFDSQKAKKYLKMDKKSYEIRKRVIAAVRRRRAIYDTRVKEHKIVHLKEKAWADAAQEVNMSSTYLCYLREFA